MERREKIIKHIQEMCESLMNFGEIRSELIKNRSKLHLILSVDKEIKKIEKEIFNYAEDLVFLDSCECSVNGDVACSSPLCPSQYNNYENK